jgi:hypothetical protein
MFRFSLPGVAALIMVCIGVSSAQEPLPQPRAYKGASPALPSQPVAPVGEEPCPIDLDRCAPASRPRVIIHYAEPIIETRNAECHVKAPIQPCGHYPPPCGGQYCANAPQTWRARNIFKRNCFGGGGIIPAAPAAQPFSYTTTAPAFAVATVPISLQTTAFGYNAVTGNVFGAGLGTGVGVNVRGAGATSAEEDLFAELSRALASQLIESIRASAASQVGKGAGAAAAGAGANLEDRVSTLERDVLQLKNDMADIKNRLKVLCGQK